MKKYNLNPIKMILLALATLGIMLYFTYDVSFGLWGTILTVALSLLFPIYFDEMDILENVAERSFTKDELVIFFCYLYMAWGNSFLILFGLNPPQ